MGGLTRAQIAEIDETIANILWSYRGGVTLSELLALACDDFALWADTLLSVDKTRSEPFLKAGVNPWR